MTSLLYGIITYHAIHVVMATKTLYIGGLFDLGKKDSWGVIPAAQIAVEEINNSSLLAGYRLELLVNDTRNGNFKLASGVHNYLDNGPKKLMLLGPVENDIAKSIAYYAALPQYGLLQFSYGTDDLTLAKDRNLYPYFFRTGISAASLDDLRISFIKHFPDWTEVGIVHGDNLFNAQLSHQLKDDLQSKGIKVLAEVRLQPSDPGRVIRTMQEKDVHIIFGLFSLDIAARKLFCQAYKSGLYGPHYVWILQMATFNSWWIPRTGEDIGGCSEIEMTCQIQNHFNVKPTYIFNERTDYALSNKNTSLLMKEYSSRVDGNTTSNRSSNAWLIYDAVWSIAHVLENSKPQLDKPLENITYGDTKASMVFYNETLKLNFKSPTLNSVRYYSNGNRKFDMNINQVIIKEDNSNPSTVVAGSYDFLSGKFEESKINWRAGTPYRKTTDTYSTRYIHRTLFVVLIFLACLGLLYALICLVVTLLYRKQKLIWNSSPIVNIIIILGCIINYITIILYAFDWSTTNLVTSLCRARAWTFALGFTLSVGGLVAKLWIAYCVLTERFVRKWQNVLIRMVSIVLVLFVLDLIIMGCWEGIDPLNAKMVVYKDQEMYKCFQPITAKTFYIDWYTVEHCTCNHPVLWLLIILFLKFAVVIFGVFLAWQTRKLYIKSLNDTQHCGFCLYLVFFCALVGVLCALLTTKLPDVFFGIVGTLIFLCTTLILALLHIHKMGRVVCRSRSRRAKNILVGSEDDPKSTVNASCPCLTCSAACCISLCSCFPCCNLYTLFRKCFYGSQVHPSKDDGKTEFYINGQAQEKDGQIAYLLRELRERDAQLARLRPSNNLTSIWTQTSDDEMNDEEEDDGEYAEGENDLNENSGNVNNDGDSNSRSRRKRRKRNSVKIFSKGADYSHIKSKVNSGVVKPSSRLQKDRDEKYYLGVWQAKGGRSTDAEIAKLRAQLAEKDKEIERLKKEKGITNPSSKITIINEENSHPNTEEKHCQTDDTSPATTGSQTRKTSKNDAKDKVIVIKPKDEREVKIEEEKPVQSNTELFGKPARDEEIKPESKEEQAGRSTSIVTPKDAINVIITPAQNEEKIGKQKDEKNDNKINNQKEKQTQDEDESKKLEKLEEKENEKQMQERRKSIFSFFRSKDSNQVESAKDEESEPKPSKGDSKSHHERHEPLDVPKGDKTEKSESTQMEKPDQPVKPEPPIKDQQDNPEKLDLPKNDPEKRKEKLDLAKPDETVLNSEPTEDETRKQDEFDDEESSPIRPPQNTPVSPLMPKEKQPADENSLNKPISGHEPSDGKMDDNDEGKDKDGDNNNDENVDIKYKPKPKRKKKRVGSKLKWNAVAKVDTTNSSYKRRPTKKTKADDEANSSDVKSKVSNSPNKDENKDNKNIKPRKKVNRKRWSPNESS